MTPPMIPPTSNLPSYGSHFSPSGRSPQTSTSTSSTSSFASNHPRTPPPTPVHYFPPSSPTRHSSISPLSSPSSLSSYNSLYPIQPASYPPKFPFPPHSDSQNHETHSIKRRPRTGSASSSSTTFAYFPIGSPFYQQQQQQQREQRIAFCFGMSGDEVMELLMAAHYMSVPELVSICCKMLADNIDGKLP